MKRTSLIRLLTVIFAVALVLAGCGDTDDDDPVTAPSPDDEADEPDPDEDPPEADEETDEETDEVATAPGLEGCADDPRDCNSGERADGGSITWLVDQTPDAWFSISAAGGSVYTLQTHHGISPYTGQWMPDSVYDYNMDLLSAEPELVNDNPITVEFSIRDEAVWSDGTPITADDFAILWMLSTGEDEGHCTGCDSRSSASFDAIESIEGSDDGKTVTITYKEGQGSHEWYAFASAHSIAGGLVPAHVAGENGFDIGTPEGVGEYFEFLHTQMPTWSGGPYQLVEGDLENQVIKEPNPNWYGEVQPTLDTVIIRYLTDAGSWVPAISNREIHGGSPASFEEDVFNQIDQLPGVEAAAMNGPSWSHLDVNVQNEQLSDPALRRAIFTVIDAEDMAERVWGTAFPDYRVRKNHIFDEDSEFFVDHVTPTGQGSGDVDLALEILEEAGYELDGGTLMLDGEQIGPFRLRAGQTSVLDTTTALMQSYLGDIGVEVVLETTESLGETLSTQDYDLMQFGWSGSPFFANSSQQFWSSTSGSNFGGYSNPEVDELVAAAYAAVTMEESAELANQAMELVVEDAYVLPLYDTPVMMMVTDEYVHVRDNANTSLRALYEHHAWGLVAD